MAELRAVIHSVFSLIINKKIQGDNMAQKKQKKSNFLPLFIVILIAVAIGYYYNTQPSAKETYGINTKGEGAFGYKASFINLTGKDAEDKKIGLSDDYWSSGKFK